MTAWHRHRLLARKALERRPPHVHVWMQRLLDDTVRCASCDIVVRAEDVLATTRMRVGALPKVWWP